MSGAPTEVSVDQHDSMECDDVIKRANIGLLDADAIAHLATFLPLRALLAASCVCSDWRRTFAACVDSIAVSNVSLGHVPLEHALAQLSRRFPSISSLRLHGPTVTDAQVHAAAQLNPALTSLDLTQCDNVTDDAIAMLALETPGLRILNVLGCRDITNDGIRRLGDGCGGLTSLCLGWCDLSDNALLVLSKKCTLLESLDVSGCGRLSDAGVSAVTTGCRRLATLSIEGCREVSAWAVAAGSAPLTSLNMGGCTLVTDAGVGAIAAAHPRLRSLSLRLCRSVGDVALRFLAMRCASLASLDISRCGSVTDAGISTIAAACPELRDVDLEGYSDITDCALYALAQNCVRLESVNLWVCSQVRRQGCRRRGHRARVHTRARAAPRSRMFGACTRAVALTAFLRAPESPLRPPPFFRCRTLASRQLRRLAQICAPSTSGAHAAAHRVRMESRARRAGCARDGAYAHRRSIARAHCPRPVRATRPGCAPRCLASRSCRSRSTARRCARCTSSARGASPTRPSSRSRTTAVGCARLTWAGARSPMRRSLRSPRAVRS